MMVKMIYGDDHDDDNDVGNDDAGNDGMMFTAMMHSNNDDHAWR